MSEQAREAAITALRKGNTRGITTGIRPEDYADAVLAAVEPIIRAEVEGRAGALLGRLVTAIYHDRTAEDWIKQAPAAVVEALADAQRFCGVK
jgi:hypothetical protein